MSESGQGTRRPVTVAIDGPAGSGKSSVSKAVAKRRGYAYLDTGAAYRAFAWFAIHRGVPTDDASRVRELIGEFSGRPASALVGTAWQLDGQDITAEIRSDTVSAAVSGYSRLQNVREMLNRLFRTVMGTVDASGIVVEGRDITTVVAPDATVRVLLTARPEVRAARRARQAGRETDVQQVSERIRARDAKDSQVVEFQKPADGVVVVDTSDLTFEESVDRVLSLIDQGTAREDGADQ